MCILEHIENKIYKKGKHPCKFAKGDLLRQCTATDDDLVEVEEGELW
jgi:hypothetical protein